MKIATIKLKWNRSVSADVEKQLLTIQSGDKTLVDTVLPPGIEEFTFEASEKSFVHTELRANDGVFSSVPAILDFEVPDLEFPAAPTNLSFTIVAVKDEPPQYA